MNLKPKIIAIFMSIFFIFISFDSYRTYKIKKEIKEKGSIIKLLIIELPIINTKNVTFTFSYQEEYHTEMINNNIFYNYKVGDTFERIYLPKYKNYFLSKNDTLTGDYFGIFFFLFLAILSFMLSFFDKYLVRNE